MRIISFQQNWLDHVTNKPKLSEPEFTTYRFPRKDRGWSAGEIVKVVYRTRSKDRVELGEAKIVALQATPSISDFDAQRDGFENREAMFAFLWKNQNPVWYPDKLILAWVNRYPQFYEFFKEAR